MGSAPAAGTPSGLGRYAPIRAADPLPPASWAVPPSGRTHGASGTVTGWGVRRVPEGWSFATELLAQPASVPLCLAKTQRGQNGHAQQTDVLQLAGGSDSVRGRSCRARWARQRRSRRSALTQPDEGDARGQAAWQHGPQSPPFAERAPCHPAPARSHGWALLA